MAFPHHALKAQSFEGICAGNSHGSDMIMIRYSKSGVNSCFLAIFGIFLDSKRCHWLKDLQFLSFSVAMEAVPTAVATRIASAGEGFASPTLHQRFAAAWRLPSDFFFQQHLDIHGDYIVGINRDESG